MKKLQKISLFALLTAALLIPALITSCQIPDTGNGIPDGYGAVKLNIGGISNLRTILPTGVTTSNFLSYKLTFTPSSGDPVIKDVAAASISDAISLVPGTYSLAVIAYTQAGQVAASAAAHYEQTGVSITAGSTTPITIMLSAYNPADEDGNGTFSWNITTTGITGLSVASMKISPILPGGSTEQTISILAAGRPNSSETLTAGYYNLTFDFTATAGTFTFQQTLWIYMALTSSFSITLTDAHFGVTPLVVTLNFNDGATPNQTLNIIPPNSTLTAQGLSLPTPTRTGYSFDGWYSDDTIFSTSFTNTTTVTANIDVYANWIQDGSAQDSSGPDFAAGSIGGTPLTLTYSVDSAAASALTSGGTVTAGINEEVVITITNASSFTGITWTWNNKNLSDPTSMVSGTDNDVLTITDSTGHIKTSAAATYLIFVKAAETGGAPQSTYFTVIVAP